MRKIECDSKCKYQPKHQHLSQIRIWERTKEAIAKQRSIPMVSLLCLAILLLGCSAPTPTQATEDSAVEKLSQTGLYSDIKQNKLAEGVMPFTPQFKLWTDGATKKRWIYLPPGSKINSQDMDMWNFPVGTKLWKEFVRDGKRIETRLLHKIKDGVGMQGWVMAAYIWNESQTDAIISLAGANNQKGTEHDVPSAAACTECHGGRESVSLGFSAIQLSHSKEGLQLPKLIEQKQLSHPPKGIFKVPGTEEDKFVLGYFHANCSSCHNSENKNLFSNPLQENKMSLLLKTSSLKSLAETELYKTAVKQGNQRGPITPGDANKSRLFQFMGGNNAEREMPPMGTELKDQQAMQRIQSWINQLKP